MYGYQRGVFGMSQKLGEGNILYGGEAYHDDGPWVNPDDYWKFNGILTYSQGDKSTAPASPRAAITANGIPATRFPPVLAQTNFFGAINPTDGGNSQRYSLQAEWHRHDENSETKIMAYRFYYDLDLFSDFTYFLTDTNEATSSSSRTSAGWPAWMPATRFSASGSAGTWKTPSACKSATTGSTTAFIRRRTGCAWTRLILGTGNSVLPADTDVNDFTDTQVGFYAENKIQWAEKFRSVAALRGDLDYFDVTSLSNPANSGRPTLFSPAQS